MSWLFSRALVAASSVGICSAGEPSAPSKSTPTPQAYLWHGKTTAAWLRFPSGMTCAPSTDNDGEALLTWCLAVSPAKTSAQPVEVRALPVSSPASGLSSLGSFARFDLASPSWRTPQCSLFEDSASFLGTWPRSGSMQSGMCWERPTLAPTTSEIGSGSLLPTPTASDYGTNRSQSEGAVARASLATMARKCQWPTPRARDWKKAGGNRHSPDLSTAVKNQAPQAGGPLNPTWVEWLMGWPLGWTDCAQPATARFRRWRQSHG